MCGQNPVAISTPVRDALLGLVLLVALLWWERGQRPHRTSVQTFERMAIDDYLRDCA